MEELVRRAIVSGRVQGVGFRWATRREARRLGLRGFVRNLPDGTVEAVVCGDPEAVEAMRRFLARGPDAARVDDLTWDVDAGPRTYGDFELR